MFAPNKKKQFKMYVTSVQQIPQLVPFHFGQNDVVAAGKKKKKKIKRFD